MQKTTKNKHNTTVAEVIALFTSKATKATAGAQAGRCSSSSKLRWENAKFVFAQHIAIHIQSYLALSVLYSTPQLDPGPGRLLLIFALLPPLSVCMLLLPICFFNFMFEIVCNNEARFSV